MTLITASEANKLTKTLDLSPELDLIQIEINKAILAGEFNIVYRNLYEFNHPNYINYLKHKIIEYGYNCYIMSIGENKMHKTTNNGIYVLYISWDNIHVTNNS